MIVIAPQVHAEKRRHRAEDGGFSLMPLQAAIDVHQESGCIGFGPAGQFDDFAQEPQTSCGLTDDQLGRKFGLGLPENDQDVGLEQSAKPGAFAGGFGGEEVAQLLLSENCAHLVAFDEPNPIPL
jgi:hypothetical protein